MGGTFDPVHRGHVLMARAICDKLGVNALHMMPNGKPPHRSQTVASDIQRVDMLSLALMSLPKLSVEPYEVMTDANNEQGHRTYDTLQHFRQRLDERCPLYWCMGQDSLNNFTQWYRWQDLLTLAHIIVVPRRELAIKVDTKPEVKSECQAECQAECQPRFRQQTELPDLLTNSWVNDTQELKNAGVACKEKPGKLLFLDVPEVNVSATSLRAQLKDSLIRSKGHPMLDWRVMNYINENNLYV